MKETADQDFLEFLVKSLVDHPDDVKVERKVDEMGVLLSLRVNAMDMGQVVGRQGATAKAIRSLLRIAMGRFCHNGPIELARWRRFARRRHSHHPWRAKRKADRRRTFARCRGLRLRAK